MNQDPKSKAHIAAIEAAVSTYQGLRNEIEALTERLATATAVSETMDRSMIRLQSENEMLRASLTSAEAKVDFYIRYSTEFATNVQHVLDVCEKLKTQAKHAAFRPNGPRDAAAQTGLTAVETAMLSVGDEVPKFLTEPRSEGGNFAAERRTANEASLRSELGE